MYPALVVILVALQPSPGVRKAILARYASIERAFENKNGLALDAVLAPDYVAVHRGSPNRNREDVLRSFVALGHQAVTERLVDRITKITVQGKNVQVSFQSKLHAVLLGTGSRTHSLDVVADEQDTWRQYGGSWKIAKTVFNGFTGKRDGVVQAGN